MVQSTCSITGCDRLHYARGWCSIHWRRWQRHGDPTMIHHVSSVMPYLLDTYCTVTAHDPGWPFTVGRDGYGQLTIGGHSNTQSWLVHRYVWTLEHGPIPGGLCVCHSCDTPSCFWIDHLWLGTHAENMADMVAKRRHFRHR